ncbi:MAG: MBL fold metallo-hydrolase [Bacilli bacterium]
MARGKKISKASKTIKTILILIIFIGTLFYISPYVTSFEGNIYNVTENEDFLGTVTIHEGEEYNEMGWTYTFLGVYHKSLAPYVTVTYRKGENVVSDFTTDEIGTYTVEYNLEYKNIKKTETQNLVIVTTDTVLSDDISFHFMTFGNKYAGDCTYIKAGDMDILIDSGSRTSSATIIENYIDQFCTDNTLEYVIATHAHQDHIAGFIDTSSTVGIFSYYECDTIIDFPRTNSTTVTYNKYIAARDAEVALGAEHFTALQCWNNEDGAQRSYEIGQSLTMNILYNYYYEHDTSDENSYSVCTLFTDNANNKNFLLCGDLQSEGSDESELKLVENNDLPIVDLFKANHHGSYNGNVPALVDVIQPKIVVFCCVAGSDEYTDTDNNQFPSQQAIDNMAKWTKQMYVTTVVSDNEDGYEDMNGNIVVSCESGEVSVDCSNNNTMLKDTDWFAAHRIWPENGVK